MDMGFVISEHWSEILRTALFSMIPMFEGRYALTLGIGLFNLPVVLTYFVVYIASLIPMPFIFWLFKPILRWIYTLPIGWLKKFAAWIDRRAERNAGKVDKKGLTGLFLFVALPLPGTGVYMGSAIATILDMNKRQAGLIIALGNAVACLIMTLATTGVLSFLQFLL